MKILLLLATVVVASQAASVSDFLPQWTEFKTNHKKYYGTITEEAYAYRNFLHNIFKIAAHNLQYELGIFSYTLKLNKYSDLSQEEINGALNGFKKTSNQNLAGTKEVPIVIDVEVELPESRDWRDEGVVSEVKDQYNCASDWAFSTAGCLETLNARMTGVLVPLSAQNLMDCTTGYGNDGCNGGIMGQAFQYVIDNNHGISREDSYPYEAKNGLCRFDSKNIGATTSNFIDIPKGDEVFLKASVGLVGAVSAAIDASLETFHLYGEGVYLEPYCSSENVNHAVLIVGYGTEIDRFGNQLDYWTVKNSWGESWGDKGYIKIARNVHNNCGIASNASLALIQQNL